MGYEDRNSKGCDDIDDGYDHNQASLEKSLSGRLQNEGVQGY